MSSWNENQQEAPLECQECRRVSDEAWEGWRAYRGDVPGEDPAPILLFYCPACAEREFGPLLPRQSSSESS
jgi:hypothetical protein